MTEGMVIHRFSVALALTTLFLSLSTSARSADLPVTVLSVGARTLQVTGSDGRILTLTVSSHSLFLRQGLLVSAGDFAPGEAVLLRQRAAAGRRAEVVLLCDPDSAAMMEKYRRRPLGGMIVSAAAQTWVVQPSDPNDPLPLTVRVSARTTFHVGVALVSASAFGPGANVIIRARGLANGLLQAVSVTDATDAGTEPAQARRARRMSGEVEEVQLEAGTLTIEDAAGAQRVVGVDAATRVKVRRQPAALTGIQPGMRVLAWLGAEEDASGNPLATSVSAYDAPVKRKKGP